jgi:hypothetical protein
MRTERFAWEYDFRSEFPDARELRRLMGETIYAAERDGKFYLIDDRSLMADFLCPAQPGVDEPNWIEVLEFASDAERQQYVADHWARQAIEVRRDA